MRIPGSIPGTTKIGRDCFFSYHSTLEVKSRGDSTLNARSVVMTRVDTYLQQRYLEYHGYVKLNGKSQRHFLYYYFNTSIWQYLEPSDISKEFNTLDNYASSQWVEISDDEMTSWFWDNKRKYFWLPVITLPKQPYRSTKSER